MNTEAAPRVLHGGQVLWREHAFDVTTLKLFQTVESMESKDTRAASLILFAFADHWNLSPRQVCDLLTQLESAGLVTVTEGTLPKAKVSFTEKGKHFAQAMAQEHVWPYQPAIRSK